MKKVQRSMILAAAAMVGLPLAITRCNVHGSSPDLDQYDHPVEAGDEAAVTTGDDASTETDDSATETSPDDASSETGDKDGSAKDGGAGDGGDAEPPSCSAPAHGAACTPHAVACSSSSCSTPSDVCCATSVTTSPPTGTCGANATCIGTIVACEEAADCASGICCETPAALGGAPGTQSCAASCAIGSYQICRSNTECAGDAGCVPQSCPYGLSTYSVEACGLQTGCTATN